MNEHASCDARRAALNVTVARDGTRLHRLIDDVVYPVRASGAVARRDPMVEALFGAPGKRKPQRKQY